ncbi:MAG: hypothetical protein LBR98_04370 [Syntrophomonadaceae bacterium]|nr:hypothetical protein [Syntrophomonadaceae bacterium]
MAAMALLTCATSFGYAAQSTYYSEFPCVTRYGGERAMAVYQVFDNSGQVMGPLIFAAAMTGGYSLGLLLIGVMTGICVALFSMLNKAKDKKSLIEHEDVSDVG